MKESIIKRYGNKRYLDRSTNFIKYFPICNRSGRFVDVFCGTGYISFRYMEKMKEINRPISIIMNDKDDKLIKFFEIFATQMDEFERRLKWRWQGSERIMECKDNIDEAIKWYLENQRTVHFTRPNEIIKRFDQYRKILDYHSVLFTDKDYRDMIKTAKGYFNRLKARTTMNGIFYCDPPYDRTTGYNIDFELDEFLDDINDLKKVVENELPSQNLFIFINLNKTDFVQEKLSDWHFKQLCGLEENKLTHKERIEMLYSNMPIKKRLQHSINRYF